MRSLRLKKILAGIMITLVAAVAIGCTNSNTSGENNSSISADNLNKEEDVTNDAINEVENDIESDDEAEESKMIELTLYSKDVNTEEEVILGKVEIDENNSLEDKIKSLSLTLSEKAFDSLPINLVEIKELEGKKIAVFNLDEVGNNVGDITPDKYEGISWVNNYFAGSAGGSITEFTLIQTLLQKEYTGEWIDGLEFTYKGTKVEFDHVPELSEIIYR